MRYFLRLLLGLSVMGVASPALAQTTPPARVPLCLQYPSSNTYVPCTGIVPVDPTTGHPLNWSDVFSGSGGGTPDAATATNQTTGNSSLATIASTVATPASATPSTAQFVAGKDQSGNARGIATSTNGGLLPGQAAPTSTRTVISASTITTIDSARSGRLGLSIQVEASPSANIYLCANGQSATCSATVYDAMIPSGAASGTIYTFMFAPTGAVYAFTTGTPSVNTTSWLAQ